MCCQIKYVYSSCLPICFELDIYTIKTIEFIHKKGQILCQEIN